MKKNALNQMMRMPFSEWDAKTFDSKTVFIRIQFFFVHLIQKHDLFVFNRQI